MKLKYKYLIFLILLIVFTCSMVEKTLQNDTFFYISLGKYIATNNTIDGYDHITFHENLKFPYQRLALLFNLLFCI